MLRPSECCSPNSTTDLGAIRKYVDEKMIIRSFTFDYLSILDCTIRFNALFDKLS